MAISDIEAFTHLTDADIESLATELDAIRRDVEDDLGERDARYIRRAIAAQRALEAAGRLMLAFGSRKVAWWAGVGTIALAKIIENMEIAHNVLHGQWDWMNDPEIHSSTWEWDMVGVSKHWRITHNVAHHKYTNILGMDDDVGYGVLRVTRDEPWQPGHLLNLPINTMLAVGFEWGIGLQHLESRKMLQPQNRAATAERLKEFGTKAGRQLAKDYLVFPALTALSPGGRFASTVKANILAGIIRNLWTNAVIFCGHFPDGAEKFTATDMAGEGQGQWYLRQMLGSANIDAGPVLAFMTGNLSYQIEHHLYPDLPSRRLAEIAVRVRQVCQKYDLPYTSGPLPVQYAKTWRTIAKLSLPDRFLRDTADNAPETRSERMFEALATRQRGLKTALAAARANRRRSRSATVR
jgi:linoleoyl-CoA desaturase